MTSNPRPTQIAILTILVLGFGSAASLAQPLGTYSWQQQPHCNVITVTVVQAGGIYHLDGTDDQRGAVRKASADREKGTIAVFLQIG